MSLLLSTLELRIACTPTYTTLARSIAESVVGLVDDYCYYHYALSPTLSTNMDEKNVDLVLYAELVSGWLIFWASLRQDVWTECETVFWRRILLLDDEEEKKGDKDQEGGIGDDGYDDYYCCHDESIIIAGGGGGGGGFAVTVMCLFGELGK